jgi:hypothetical protein
MATRKRRGSRKIKNCVGGKKKRNTRAKRGSNSKKMSKFEGGRELDLNDIKYLPNDHYRVIQAKNAESNARDKETEAKAALEANERRKKAERDKWNVSNYTDIQNIEVAKSQTGELLLSHWAMAASVNAFKVERIKDNDDDLKSTYYFTLNENVFTLILKPNKEDSPENKQKIIDEINNIFYGTGHGNVNYPMDEAYNLKKKMDALLDEQKTQFDETIEDVIFKFNKAQTDFKRLETISDFKNAEKNHNDAIEKQKTVKTDYNSAKTQLDSAKELLSEVQKKGTFAILPKNKQLKITELQKAKDNFTAAEQKFNYAKIAVEQADLNVLSTTENLKKVEKDAKKWVTEENENISDLDKKVQDARTLVETLKNKVTEISSTDAGKRILYIDNELWAIFSKWKVHWDPIGDLPMTDPNFFPPPVDQVRSIIENCDFNEGTKIEIHLTMLAFTHQNADSQWRYSRIGKFMRPISKIINYDNPIPGENNYVYIPINFNFTIQYFRENVTTYVNNNKKLFKVNVIAHR